MAYFTLLVLGLSVALALLIGWVTWRQRPRQGTTAFSVGMGGLAWLLGCMLIGNGAIAIFGAHDVGFVFIRLKWIGTHVMALGWFSFALAYTGREEYLTRRTVAFVSVVPAISVIAVLANDRVLESVASAAGLSLTLSSFDLWLGWEGIAIAYVYALILAGAILIVGVILVHRFPDPELAGLWIFAISVPLSVNVTFLTGILSPLGAPEISVDPTPIAFLLTGVIGLAGIVRYDSFGNAPIARTYVIDELRVGVLVYDENCRIVDYNEWLDSTVGVPADAVGRDVRTVLGERFDLSAPDGTRLDAAGIAGRLQDREIELERGEDTMYLKIEATPVQNPQGRPMGHSILWYDVTTQKRSQHELEAANDNLAYERDLKEQIRDTLISTATQSELERAFCNSVLGGDRVLAWVGEESATGEVTVRTQVTSDDQVNAVDGSPETTPLAERALDAGETAVENDLTTIDGGWAQPAVDAGLRSGVAVPLGYNDLSYGVFCVFATNRDAFDGRELGLLEDTAESVAYSVHAAVQRESLRSTEPMRVVLDVSDEASYLSTLANGAVPADGSIAVSEIRHGDEADAVQILAPTDVEPDAIREKLAAHEAVLSTETIGDDGAPTMRVRVAPPTVQSEIADLGGAVRSTTVTDGRVRVATAFSRRADIEEILAQLRERFPDTELVSRVYEERSGEGAPSRASHLTEKQLNALRTAYLSGFFHRPQQATANEVAEALDVSRTTFLHHLRAAERSLFERMFDE